MSRLEDYDWDGAQRLNGGGGTLRRAVADPLVALLGKGTIATGEVAAGLADLPTFGYAGKALESIGYDPAETKRIIDRNLLSRDQRLANQRVEDAEGFVGTAKAMLENPSTIAGAALESLPSTFGGGAIGKVAKKALPKLGTLAAAALGEGAVAAGAQAEGIRQQTQDGLLNGKQVLSSLASGAMTGVLGAAGGGLARKLGITDLDTAIVQGKLAQARHSLPARMAGGALSEGVFEELPQSIQEQMWENYALERPLLDNVGKAGAQGMLAGAAMGAGANVLHGGHPPADTQNPPRTPPPALPPPAPTPPKGPLERAADKLPGLYTPPLQTLPPPDYLQGEVLPPQNTLAQQRPRPPYGGDIIEGEFTPVEDSTESERTYKGLPAANKARRESGRADDLEVVNVAPQTFALREKANPQVPALPAPQQENQENQGQQRPPADIESYRAAVMNTPEPVRWDELPPAERAQLREVYQDGFDARALGERGEPPAHLNETERKVWIAGAIEHDAEAPQRIDASDWGRQALLRREQRAQKAMEQERDAAEAAQREAREQHRREAEAQRQQGLEDRRQGTLSDDEAQQHAIDRWRHGGSTERAQMLKEAGIEGANHHLPQNPPQHLIPALAAAEKAAFAKQRQQTEAQAPLQTPQPQPQDAQESTLSVAMGKRWDKLRGFADREALLQRLGASEEDVMRGRTTRWGDFTPTGREALARVMQAQEEAAKATEQRRKQKGIERAKAPAVEEPPRQVVTGSDGGLRPRTADGKPVRAGERFTTQSGRHTTPYPGKALLESPQGVLEAQRWLMENALQEALARRDEDRAQTFKARLDGLQASKKAERKALSEADRVLASLYLWGDTSAPETKAPSTPEKRTKQPARQTEQATEQAAPPVKPGHIRPIPLKLEGWTGSKKELAKLAREIYARDLQGEVVDNASLGARVAFTSEGKGEAFGASGRVRSGVRAEMVKALKALVESATAVAKEAPQKGRESDSKAFHTLVNALEVEGQVIPVRLTIREALHVPKGEPAHKFYDVKIEEKEKPSRLGLSDTGSPRPIPNGALDIKVADLAAAFNSETPKAQETTQKPKPKTPPPFDILKAPVDERGQPSEEALQAFVDGLPARERAALGSTKSNALALFQEKRLRLAYGDNKLATLAWELRDPKASAHLRYLLEALTALAPQAAELAGTPYAKLRSALALAARQSAHAGNFEKAASAKAPGSSTTLTALAREVLGTFSREYSAREAVELENSWASRALEALRTQLERDAQDKAQGQLFGERPQPSLQQVLQRLNEPAAVDYKKRGERPAPAKAAPAAQAKPEKAKQTAKPASIEDFGEKLGGARKDNAPSLKRELSSDAIAAQPLSKLWPKDTADAIEDPQTSALVTVLREQIPAKPRKPHALARWVKKVQGLREVARDLVSGELSAESYLGSMDISALTRGMADKVRLLTALAREHWPRIGEVRRFPESGEHFAVVIDGRRQVLRETPTTQSAAERVRELLQGEKEPAKLQFVGWVSDNGEFWISKKGDKTKLISFPTLEETRQYLKDHHAELVALWEKHKKERNVRESDLRGKENRARIGEDWRKGKDISPAQFGETFGFRGVEFGNWVGKTQERQEALNQAYDALMDLADVLGVPPRALSLAGRLGLAFGARGKGGKGSANAHYEPARVVINLTKTKGAGSLAHEWFHALDNYFSRMADGEAGGFATDGLNATGGVRPEVAQAFRRLTKALDFSPMLHRSRVADNGKKSEYLAQTIERAARSFENYVMAKLAAREQYNDYLANVIPEELFERADKYPYLKKSELAPIAEAFDNLFSTLQTREDAQGNTVLFSRSKQSGAEALLQRAKEQVRQALAASRNDRQHNARYELLPVAAQEVVEAAQNGLDIEGYRHVIDGSAIRHVFKKHGNAATESARGQIAVTENDLESIPDILAAPDEVLYGLKNKIGREVIGYLKRMPDGSTVYLEEVRTRYGTLAAQSLWRYPPTVHASSIKKTLRLTSATLRGRTTESVNATPTPRNFAVAQDTPAASRSALPAELSPQQKSRLNRAKAIVERVRKAWANAPEIVVAQNINDPQIPEAARRENARQQAGGAKGNPEGFFYQGKVYLLADALHTPADVVRVLFHEVLGHYGLRGHFDKALDGVLDGIATLRKADVLVKLKAYGLADTEANRRIAAEEVLAEMAQTRPQIGWVRRAIAAIRTWLRTHVPALSGMALTNAEILNNYLLPARRYVEQGLQQKAQGKGKAAFGRGKNKAQWPFDLDNLPPMRNARTFKEAREAAKAFQGKPLTNKSTGMTATVSRNNLDKMLSASAIAKSESPAVHSSAVANADALFERAILGWSKPDRAGDPSIRAIHRFFAPMEVNGRTKMVKLTVKEVLNSGNNIYTLEAIDFGDGGKEWLADAAGEDGFSLGEKIPQRGEWASQDTLSGGISPAISAPRGNATRGDAKLAAEAVLNLAQEIEKRNQWPVNEPPPLFSRSEMDSATREALDKLGLVEKDQASLLDNIRALRGGAWKNVLKAVATRAEEGLFDGLLGIKKAEQAVGIKDAQRQGYTSARLASGLADVVHAVLHYGAPQWKNGVIARKAGTRGLLDILSDIGAKDLNNWLGWLGGKRAELLMQQGRENNLSQDDIAELLALGKGKEALFERVYRDYQAANEAVLDVAQEAGLINPAQRKAWMSDYYVPFYRMEEGDVFAAPSTRKGFSHQSAAIRALKGGKLPTQNLLTNILTAWTTRLDASLKNKALLEVVDNLKGSEYLTDESLRWKPVVLPRAQVIQKMRRDANYLRAWLEHMGLAPDAGLEAARKALKVFNREGFEQFFALQAPTDPDVIRVQRGGKNAYYRVHDKSLLRGVKFVTQSTANDPLTKMGRAFKRLLTTGVTASPDFILRNFLRDSAHTWAINRDGFKFAKDSLKGLKQAWVEE